MITRNEILETNSMISDMNLDVRTITMGISLLDCADADINKFNEKVYKKITTYAKDLVKVGDELAKEYGVPVVNKRISVTPIAIAAAGCKNADSYVSIAQTLDKAAQEVGVNFIGGFSALVQKGYTESDKILIDSIPEALAVTERVCASVNIGTSRNGLNMDAVKKMGEVIVETAERHEGQRMYRLCEASCILQCSRGQPFYGRRIPWRWGGRPLYQCRCQRPRRGKTCAGGGQRG